MPERDRGLQDTLRLLVQAVRIEAPAKPDQIMGIWQDLNLLRGQMLQEEQQRTRPSYVDRGSLQAPNNSELYLQGFEVITIAGKKPTESLPDRVIIKADEFSIEIIFESDKAFELRVDDRSEKPYHSERDISEMRQGEADLIRFCLSETIAQVIEDSG